MNFKKRPSQLLMTLVLGATSLIFLAQPFINNAARIDASQMEYNTVTTSDFSAENAYRFHNEVDTFIYPMYIDYMKSLSDKNDYDLLLTNPDEVPLEEKEQLHYIIQDKKANFQSTYGSMNYYICSNDQSSVYTNNDKLSILFADQKVSSSSNVWQIILSFNQDGILSTIDYSQKNSNLNMPSDALIAEAVKRAKSSFVSTLENSISQPKSKIVDIKNVTFIFEIDDTMGLGSTYQYTNYNYVNSDINSSYAMLFGLVNLAMFFIGLYLIKQRDDIRECKAYRASFFLPFELILFVWVILECLCFDFDYATSAIGQSNSFVGGIVVSSFYFLLIATCLSGVLAFTFFLEKAKRQGFRRTYKEQSIAFAGGAMLKDNILKGYTWLSSLDLSSLDKKQMRLLIGTHTLILFILWFIHVLLVAIYGIVLYFLWLKNIRKQRKDYQSLKDTIHRFCIGEYDVPVSETLGSYAGLKEDLVSLQESIQEAIAQEVASQRMKNELITNVSHDLKTPLTSIISYIDLLKDPTITEVDREKYLHTLEKSADRLKHLIEDLFEISKANSGNLNVNLMEADLVSLIKQVEMECNNTFQKKHLVLKHSFSDEKILMSIDPQKTYRIFENLLSNVGKYALEKTRVFIQVTDYDSRVDVEIKNISKAELDFSAEEIMERFTRGDKSRNTEGSGLGLAIAKSFTELMQGSMRIELDGDIFKVTISFYKQNAENMVE